MTIRLSLSVGFTRQTKVVVKCGDLSPKMFTSGKKDSSDETGLSKVRRETIKMLCPHTTALLHFQSSPNGA